MKTLHFLLLGFFVISLMACFKIDETEPINIPTDPEEINIERLYCLSDVGECTSLINDRIKELIVGCPDNANKYFQEYKSEENFRGDTVFLDEMNTFSSNTYKNFTTYEAKWANDTISISWTKVGVSTFESCYSEYALVK